MNYKSGDSLEVDSYDENYRNGNTRVCLPDRARQYSGNQDGRKLSRSSPLPGIGGFLYCKVIQTLVWPGKFILPGSYTHQVT